MTEQSVGSRQTEDLAFGIQQTGVTRAFRAARFGMALGFVSVAVLNVALDPNSAEDDIWFSIYVSAVGFALLWGEREGTGDRRQWFGLGGGVAVALALFFLWLGAEGLFGTPAEPIPWLLGIAAVVTGLCSLVASISSFSNWWVSRTSAIDQHQAGYGPEALGDVEQAEEPFEIVELRGALIWRHRYSVRVTETELEIRMPQLFGRKRWLIHKGAAIPGVSHLRPRRRRRRSGKTWKSRTLFHQVRTSALERPSELLWMTTRHPPNGSVTVDFDEPQISPKLLLFNAWHPHCGLAQFCRFDRRLVMTSIDLAERRPGELTGAMKRLGWPVNECPKDWGLQTAERLAEHASSSARSLDRWAVRVTVALWASLPVYFFFGVLMDGPYYRFVFYSELAFLIVGFMAIRLLRRRYWTLFTRKHSIAPALD